MLTVVPKKSTFRTVPYCTVSPLIIPYNTVSLTIDSGYVLIASSTEHRLEKLPVF